MLDKLTASLANEHDSIFFYFDMKSFWSRLSSLSRTTKALLVTGCVGTMIYLSITRYTAKRRKKRSQVRESLYQIRMVLPEPKLKLLR